jgi:N-acetylmuramoyl-L-alanine amidase
MKVHSPYFLAFVVLSMVFTTSSHALCSLSNPLLMLSTPPTQSADKSSDKQAIVLARITSVSATHTAHTTAHAEQTLTFTFTPNKRLKSLPTLRYKGNQSDKQWTLKFISVENTAENLAELTAAGLKTLTAERSTSNNRAVTTFVGTTTAPIDTAFVGRSADNIVLTVRLKKPTKIVSEKPAKEPTKRDTSKIIVAKPITTTDDDDAAPTAQRNKWALDVIVLDPGHGGKDAGAVGVTGVKEKDVVLGIAKKLGAMIHNNMPNTKVVYTRSDDTFIELDRRGQIANEAGGKLFVSIHCNSTPKKPAPANGFEVYILRPGKTEEAVRVAEAENAAIKFEADTKRYQKLTDEQFIVVNMAQSAFVKFSDKFASLLVEKVESTTPLTMRGVNQAGFYVLVGASMPNVLIETAFLSNKNDERYLKSDKGQRELAFGMFKAIKAYREYYERQFKQGK